MIRLVLVNDGSAFVGCNIEMVVAAAMNRSGSFVVCDAWLVIGSGRFITITTVAVDL